MINEPTAAALAYGLDKMSAQMKRVVVFDMGGGTTDISVLQIEGGIIEVISSRGDTHLGGQDIDELLLKHCMDDFYNKNAVHLENNKRAVARLRNQCRQVKHNLTDQLNAVIEADSITPEHDFDMTLSRAVFENICAATFQKTLEPLEPALADAQITKEEVDEVILVGGSTRIPKI